VRHCLPYLVRGVAFDVFVMFAGFFSFPVIVARFPGLVCNNEARRQVPNARHRVPSLIRRLAKRVLDLSTLKTEVVRPSGFGKKTQSTNSGLFFLHWIRGTSESPNYLADARMSRALSFPCIGPFAGGNSTG